MWTQIICWDCEVSFSCFKVPVNRDMEEWGRLFHWQTTQSHHIHRHTMSGKSSIICLLGGCQPSQYLPVLCPCCLRCAVGAAAQLLPLCPNGLLMTTTFCSTQRGRGGRGWGVFVCARLYFWNRGWVHKGDRGHPTHKTKIVMRERRRAGGWGGVDGFEEELSMMEEGSQEKRREQGRHHWEVRKDVRGV